jgi:hypothetical protein
VNRAAVILVACLGVSAVAILVSRDPETPRVVALVPDWPLLSAREDWVRTADDKLAAAAVGGCNVSSGAGDLDGDGSVDTVLAYSDERKCGEPDQVAVFLADGDTLRGPIESEIDEKTGRTCPGGCFVFAVSDLNADGRAEVVLELQRGAAVIQLGVYGLGQRGLARLPLIGRERHGPATFSYAGSVCCGGHVSCRGRDRVVASGYGATILGSVWVGETVYRFDGRRFVEISSHAEQRAGLDARGTSVPGRDCIEPRPVRNAEAELLRLYRGEV